jgi:Zn-dependent metalloprotease
MSKCRNPLHCVLPPHILRNIAENGSDKQRRWATAGLTRDASFRLVRVQNAKAGRRGSRVGALATGPKLKPNRIIRDAKGKETVTGPVVRREGEKATKDKATDEAYNGLGDTFKFFADVFSRNSIDDEGMPLLGVVHFGKNFQNAFWDSTQMVFGDGDGEILGRMTRSLDVIGHELGHGVTEDEAGLEYYGMSGALNESMSDVFGSLVKQYKKGQTAAQADWLIGAEVWTPEIEGDALRSMKDPGNAYDDPLVGKDPQPAHMNKYVETVDDNGGVHINSGIPNKAFYEVATEIGGNAWEKAGRIWYWALLAPSLKPRANFQQFAKATKRSANTIYGTSSKEAKAVRNGWDKVGIAV